MTTMTKRRAAMRQRTSTRLGWIGLLFGLCCTACSDDNDGYVYPSLLTELVVLYSDGDGVGARFTTDNGATYAVNTPLQGLQADAAYRLVCGYEPTGEYRESYPVAKVYTVESVVILQEEDGSADTEDAPTGVTAVWQGGGYLNLQLAPKTQGGEQEWGYRTDSVTIRNDGKTLHLSLCHRQENDPPSYSTTVYASLPLYQLDLQEGDSIAFAVSAFDGERIWKFVY